MLSQLRSSKASWTPSLARSRVWPRCLQWLTRRLNAREGTRWLSTSLFQAAKQRSVRCHRWRSVTLSTRDKPRSLFQDLKTRRVGHFTWTRWTTFQALSESLTKLAFQTSFHRCKRMNTSRELCCLKPLIRATREAEKDKLATQRSLS